MGRGTIEAAVPVRAKYNPTPGLTEFLESLNLSGCRVLIGKDTLASVGEAVNDSVFGGSTRGSTKSASPSKPGSTDPTPAAREFNSELQALKRIGLWRLRGVLDHSKGSLKTLVMRDCALLPPALMELGQVRAGAGAAGVELGGGGGWGGGGVGFQSRPVPPHPSLFF